jgi:HlyD family secretion protein
MTVSPATRKTRVKLRWRNLAGVLLGLAVIGVLLWVTRRGAHSREIERSPESDARKQTSLTVDVVRPRRGGISRTIQQPASIHSFESVDLYAMVSGYLKRQDVDIGSRIKKGEVLAEINVPRDAKAVEEAASLVEQARAQVVQAQARIKVTVAQQDTAAVAVKAAECDVTRLVSRRELSQKQYQRVSGLVAERAATRLLADEQQLDLETTTAAERSGNLEIDVAKAKLLAAKAAVEQAQADAAEARANLGVAEAHLERAKVNLEYSRIVAPFDGVVTHRSFHPGALIRSATEGGQPQPLLTVKRIDVMRVVVLVPDSDVVLTRQGDPAVVTVDALGGRSFQGILARIARAEDDERLMRVEIDLPNPENLLCDGMYGKAIITLERDARSLALPAACVVEHSGRSGGVVFLVRDGIARRTEVKLGGDNGTEVEIVSGISPDDALVLPAGTPLEDGMRVVAAAGKTAQTPTEPYPPALSDSPSREQDRPASSHD